MNRIKHLHWIPWAVVRKDALILSTILGVALWAFGTHVDLALVYAVAGVCLGFLIALVFALKFALEGLAQKVTRLEDGIRNELVFLRGWDLSDCLEGRVLLKRRGEFIWPVDKPSTDAS